MLTIVYIHVFIKCYLYLRNYWAWTKMTGITVVELVCVIQQGLQIYLGFHFQRHIQNYESYHLLWPRNKKSGICYFRVCPNHWSRCQIEASVWIDMIMATLTNIKVDSAGDSQISSKSRRQFIKDTNTHTFTHINITTQFKTALLSPTRYFATSIMSKSLSGFVCGHVRRRAVHLITT